MGIPKRRRCRILVIDDHADTRDLLERLLSGHFDVATAGCYHSAIAAAETAAPDIVITDIGLPDLDGIVLMRELRQRFGVAGIAVTGHVIESATEFREAGFVNWLRKPIQLSELLDAITAAQLEQRATSAVAAGLSVT